MQVHSWGEIEGEWLREENFKCYDSFRTNSPLEQFSYLAFSSIYFKVNQKPSFKKVHHTLLRGNACFRLPTIQQIFRAPTLHQWAVHPWTLFGGGGVVHTEEPEQESMTGWMQTTQLPVLLKVPGLDRGLRLVNVANKALASCKPISGEGGGILAANIIIIIITNIITIIAVSILCPYLTHYFFLLVITKYLTLC